MIPEWMRRYRPPEVERPKRTYLPYSPSWYTDLQFRYLVDNLVPRYNWLITSMESKADRVWRHQYCGEPYVAPVFKMSKKKHPLPA